MIIVIPLIIGVLSRPFMSLFNAYNYINQNDLILVWIEVLVIGFLIATIIRVQRYSKQVLDNYSSFDVNFLMEESGIVFRASYLPGSKTGKVSRLISRDNPEGLVPVARGYFLMCP